MDHNINSFLKKQNIIINCRTVIYEIDSNIYIQFNLVGEGSKQLNSNDDVYICYVW